MSRFICLPGNPVHFGLIILMLAVLCTAAIIGTDDEEEQVISYGLANKIIVVDPGHGGADPGAVRGRYVEKDITLQVSKKLADYLSQAGAMVILLREDDRDLAGNINSSQASRKRADLKKRAAIANEAKADLYISIHTNADPSPRWSGAQTFYNPSSKRSKVLAVMIQEELTEILGNTNRKAKPGSYYLLEQTKMPSVIVEIGFISNPREARQLTNDDYQSKVAFSIFSGIAKSELQEYDEEIEEYPRY
jgi:N-acetylmuramoyl-L-alanine amidase